MAETHRQWLAGLDGEELFARYLASESIAGDSTDGSIVRDLVVSLDAAYPGAADFVDRLIRDNLDINAHRDPAETSLIGAGMMAGSYLTLHAIRLAAEAEELETQLALEADTDPTPQDHEDTMS